MLSNYQTLFALALAPVLVVLAISMRIVSGSWLNPGAFFSLWWCFAAIPPLILAPYDPVNATAMTWIIVACLAVAGGAIAGNGGFKTIHSTTIARVSKVELQIWSFCLLISFVLGVVSNIAAMRKAGLSPSQLFDTSSLLRAASDQYAARFQDPTAGTGGSASRAFLPFVYLAAATGGIVFRLRHEWRWKIFALVALVPSVLVTIMETTKAAILFGLSFWLATYFATRLRTGHLKVFTAGHWVVGIVVSSILLVFLYMVSFARLGSTDADLLGLISIKLLTAALGHMSVFSRWLSDYLAGPANPSFGAVTGSGVLELLGVSKRAVGLFENPLDLFAGVTSNIFTGFRPLIQDFTVPGAIALLILFGFVGGIAFKSVANGRWAAVPVLAAIYATIFWTPITWLWVYNSLTATIVGLVFIVIWARSWRLSRMRKSLFGSPGNLIGEPAYHTGQLDQ